MPQVYTSRMGNRKLLNLDGAPEDSIKRLYWLGGVKDQVIEELNAEFREAYFDARLTQRLDAALALRLHSIKAVMAFTRAANFAKGTPVRWGDRR